MAVFLTMIFYATPKIVQYAPDMKLFDLLPGGYSLQYAHDFLSSLGEKGRHLYLYKQLPLDFIYPGLFSVSGCLLLSWLLLKSQDKNSKLFYGCLLPISAGLFDYLENLSIIGLLTSYPNISEFNVLLASSMTMMKSGLSTVFFLLLIMSVGLIFSKK